MSPTLQRIRATQDERGPIREFWVAWKETAYHRCRSAVQMARTAGKPYYLNSMGNLLLFAHANPPSHDDDFIAWIGTAIGQKLSLLNSP